MSSQNIQMKFFVKPKRATQMDECWPSFQFILLAFPQPEVESTFIIPSHLDQSQFQGFRSWRRRKERAEKNSEGWGRGWVASKRRIISLYENWFCLNRTWWIATTSPTGYRGVICDLESCWMLITVTFYRWYRASPLILYCWLANRHATKYVGTSPFSDVRSHRALDNFKDDRMKVWYRGQFHIRFCSKQRRIALSPVKFDTQ